MIGGGGGMGGVRGGIYVINILIKNKLRKIAK